MSLSRALGALAVLLLLCWPIFPSFSAERDRERFETVVLQTAQGDLRLELYPKFAPKTVRRFLERRREERVICESWPGGYLVLGCPSYQPGSLPAAGGEEEEGSGGGRRVASDPDRAPDEIDALAMGLGAQPASVPTPLDELWQRELMPRYVALKQSGRPVPNGLQLLVDGIKQRGMAATSALNGQTRLWYLQQLGYLYRSGGSPFRVQKGALCTANIWPNEADERFLIALDDIPQRDGRCTVFGRVADGWDSLERIQSLPLDRWHRTLSPVSFHLLRSKRAANSALKNTAPVNTAPIITAPHKESPQ